MRAFLACLLLAMFGSCSQESDEDLPTFLERGIYRSDPTGHEILIGDVDAMVSFKGEKLVVVAFDAADDGTLKFSPVSGRELAFHSSAISKSRWSWEPRMIRQMTDDGTVLQAFTLVKF